MFILVENQFSNVYIQFLGNNADVPSINEPFPETNGVLNDEFPISNLNGINGISSVIPNGADVRTISPAVSEKSENEPVFQTKPDFEPDSVHKWRENYEKNLKKLGKLFDCCRFLLLFVVDEDEKKMIEDLKNQAKKELEEFEKKRETDLENRKKDNR